MPVGKILINNLASKNTWCFKINHMKQDNVSQNPNTIKKTWKYKMQLSLKENHNTSLQ